MENTNNIKKNSRFGFKSMPAQSGWIELFINAIATRNCFNCEGRASRKEYWAVNIIVFFINTLLLAALFTSSKNDNDLVSFYHSMLLIEIIEYCLYIPLFTLSVRRFHDINMSAWWGVLFIPLLFLPFFKGDKKDNKYGANIYPTTED